MSWRGHPLGLVKIKTCRTDLLLSTLLDQQIKMAALQRLGQVAGSAESYVIICPVGFKICVYCDCVVWRKVLSMDWSWDADRLYCVHSARTHGDSWCSRGRLNTLNGQLVIVLSAHCVYRCSRCLRLFNHDCSFAPRSAKRIDWHWMRGHSRN
jgi:hypothetical protein